jgi:hypothetical protein
MDFNPSTTHYRAHGSRKSTVIASIVAESNALSAKTGSQRLKSDTPATPE